MPQPAKQQTSPSAVDHITSGSYKPHSLEWPFSWALEPEYSILMFMWALGALDLDKSISFLSCGALGCWPASWRYINGEAQEEPFTNEALANVLLERSVNHVSQGFGLGLVSVIMSSGENDMNEVWWLETPHKDMYTCIYIYISTQTFAHT